MQTATVRERFFTNVDLVRKALTVGIDHMPIPEVADLFHKLNDIPHADEDSTNNKLAATLRQLTLARAIGIAPGSRFTTGEIKARLDRMHDGWFSALIGILSHLDNDTPSDAIGKWASKVISNIEGLSENDFDFLKNDDSEVARTHAFVCRDFFHQVMCIFHKTTQRRPEDIILESLNTALNTYGTDPEIEHFRKNSIPMAKLAAKVMGIA